MKKEDVEDILNQIYINGQMVQYNYKYQNKDEEEEECERKIQ